MEFETWPFSDYASAAVEPRGSSGLAEAPPISSALSLDTRSSLERLLESAWGDPPGHYSSSGESSAGSGASGSAEGGDFQQPESPPAAALSVPRSSHSESVNRPIVVNHYHYHIPQPFDYGRTTAQNPVDRHQIEELPPTTLHKLPQILTSLQEPGGVSNPVLTPSLPLDHPIMSHFLSQPISSPTPLNPICNPRNGERTSDERRVSVNGSLTTQSTDMQDAWVASRGIPVTSSACPVPVLARPPKYPPVFSRPHPPRPQKRPGSAQAEPRKKRAKSGTALRNDAIQSGGKRTQNGSPDGWLGPFCSPVDEAPKWKSAGERPSGDPSVIEPRVRDVSGLLMGALKRFVAGPPSSN